MPEQGAAITAEKFQIDPRWAQQQLNDKVGMKLLEVTKERVVGTIPVEGNLQPYGLLHGGANAVLAEALGSTVAAVNAGPERAAVGLELSCTHHRGVREGLVTGVAVPLHVGRSTITVEIVLTDDAGKRTCTARLTCAVRERPPGS
ncbi:MULTISPECIES: PaaI family thioesterase [unclassified Amycolatopsis]|uniref:PaaI family thioesterase n=1 Tax=unclassified Amycolatopsis TaxID=2618356 RepID=UPI0012AA1711|nr:MULTISPECIES: hotdog fold thioesterase [unclassified Amycolatopsis]QFU91576.1 Proofreading thioesterase EntH [Amycolatopsis sp. YIM 10]